MQEKETLSQNNSQNQINHIHNDVWRDMKAVKPIPIIRTFESATETGEHEHVQADMPRGGVKKENISSPSAETNIQNMVHKQDRKHKAFLLLTLGLVFCFVSGAVFAAYYVYKEKNKPLPIKVIEVKKYYISDIFQDVKSISLLKSYTGEATSSKNVFDDKYSYGINVLDFDNLYQKIISQEGVISDIAKSKYGYASISDFKDVTIQNIDMRMADGEEGLVVYGYFKKEKLIISNNINEYLKLYNSL